MQRYTSGKATAHILRGYIKAIDQTAERAAAWNGTSRLLPQEMEWLLDNRYLCRREGAAALAALRGAKLTFILAKRKVRKTHEEHSFSERSTATSQKRVPYAYTLADEYLEKCGGEVTEAGIGRFLKEKQSVRTLMESELWLFTTMLRAALLARVAACCEDINEILSAFQRTDGDSPFTAEARAYALRQTGRVPDRGTEEFAEAAEGAHRRNAERMGALITSLRFLSSADLTETLQSVGALETAFQKDPIYGQMDEETRGAYRQQLARLARRAGISEQEAAAKVLSLCGSDGHIGEVLWNKPLGGKPSRWPGRIYFITFALLTLIPGAACAIWTERIWAGLLLLLPLSAMAKNITDTFATRLAHQRPVPRLELPDGLPEEGKTLTVVSALLTDGQKGAEYAKKLEAYRLANRDAGENLLFGLLADLPDGKQKSRPADERVLSEAQQAIFALNRKYGGGFFLFTRDREWNVRGQTYMAWERKRGALLELCRLLRDKPCALRVATGDKAVLAGTQFLITLDGDTALTPGSARRMAGALMHPGNRPVVDPVRRVVTRGHGVLAPRMAVDLDAAGRSVFSRVFAGQGGLDPYSGVAGEVYHDLFGQGSFHGKGIFDIDAYLECLDGRFPENRILSHDLLEGNYLRAGLMEDVELSDGFPSTARAWFMRQHRWIRGDWQAASWILFRTPTAGKRQKERNPLNALSRWKLLDTLRSSLVPVATLAALTAGTLLPGRVFGIILAVALIASASHLLLSLAERLSKPSPGRTHAAVITGLPAVLWQTLLMLCFLPYNAFISAHAAVIALWRVCVSHKNLLQWTTSEETEKLRSGIIGSARNMFPGLVWGVLTACLSRSVTGWLLGAGWAASPFIAHAVSKTIRYGERVGDADRAFLLRQAALMWQYFEDFLTKDDHFLIPDNFQEQPAAGAAHRTSPTNIGLSLLCALAAADLGLCPAERALSLIDSILATLEGLPKWHGHILNWYDTRTLEPLPPRCVSSVDSGNLCGCLIALREGLIGMDGEEAERLALRAGALADGMDFKPLYDEKRKQFFIGADLDNPEGSSGVYDLLASEARQTSYIAVARGEVDKKHWQRLGRAQTALGRYRGMASWTGTMFEYFMPHLLLPAYRNSLLRESLDFAVTAQRSLASRFSIPWGVSESCFYAFDRSLNYQYKAHGIPALAYKRGLGADRVISPYSSFLTLLTHPAASVRNLRRLHGMGIEGIYGLIEAIDFTPSRVTQSGSGKGFLPVRCYMSHHLGMSLVAVCNVLRDNIMQKRFMSDAAMGAFAGLLQERLPVGGAVIRPAGRDVPEKPRRAEGTHFVLEIERAGLAAPKTALLGNASYSVLCADNGQTRSQCGNDALTLFSARGSGHMRFFFDGLSLLPEGQEGFSASFSGTKAVWSGTAGSVISDVSVSVPGNENAELRVVTLRSKSKEAVTGLVSCYFEPVLQRAEDFTAHPAFSKLFLDARIQDGVCLIRRRPRSGKRELWLAFACDKNDVRYETSREAVLGRGGAVQGQKHLSEQPYPAIDSGEMPPPIDPCVYAAIPVTLPPGEKITLRFALAYAARPSDAAAAAMRTLRQSGGESQLPNETARTIGLTPSEREEALEWLSRMVYPNAAPAYSEGLPLGRGGLWSVGISGDVPLLAISATDNAQWERASRAVRQHRWLNQCGFSCDLAVLLRDGGDYRRPARTLLMETLKACHAEHTVARKGGIHPVDLGSLALGQEALIKAFASVVITDNDPVRDSFPQNDNAKILSKMKADVAESHPVAYRWEHDGSFNFEIQGVLPPLAWSHTLANRNFGALVTETGAGYCWFQNARENKLTPWTNDPLAVGGGISLAASMDGKSAGLFASGDGFPCNITYGFGFARWEKKLNDTLITTTQFVPLDRTALVTVIETEKPCIISLSAETVMGEKDGRLCLTRLEDDGSITVENPFNTAYSPQMIVCAASEPVNLAPGKAGQIALSFELNGRAVLVIGATRNRRGAALLREIANTEVAAEALERTKRYWSKAVCPVPVRTGRAALDHYGNGWALYQVIVTRIYARTSLYQCGGAFGFRDQLQDVCAALRSEPRLAKTQILRACSRQYEEGDVMHWWHPANRTPGFSDKGVRTRCSDDLLWLPYVVAEYCERTGETSLLSLETPYLSSEPLRDGEDDRYESAAVTARRGSVYEHCLRAFEMARVRGVGERGLLLMGAGDWNDGMNLVGHKGRGESVWLTWFTAHTAQKFSVLCKQTGDAENARELTAWADGLIAAASEAWDGKWFLRGTYDDGTTLGSQSSEECQIDSIAQSFATLFPGQVPPDYVKTALESAAERLIDKDAKMIRLFAPPFSGKGTKDPGYIRGYVPGVRENGGQYTHAAIWLAMAFLKTGERERCLDLLEMLLPETHDNTIYKAEPHVLAADVYGHPAHLGRGGWSHYTGAASWFYRVLLDALDQSGNIG